jgi:hypothetical protein
MNLESALTNHITFYTGLSYQSQNNHNFQRVEDLLGGGVLGKFKSVCSSSLLMEYLDADKINLLDTDVKRKVGDSYGYDYNILFSKAAWFGQGVFTYNKFDFFACCRIRVY